MLFSWRSPKNRRGTPASLWPALYFTWQARHTALPAFESRRKVGFTDWCGSWQVAHSTEGPSVPLKFRVKRIMSFLSREPTVVPESTHQTRPLLIVALRRSPAPAPAPLKSLSRHAAV